MHSREAAPRGMELEGGVGIPLAASKSSEVYSSAITSPSGDSVAVPHGIHSRTGNNENMSKFGTTEAPDASAGTCGGFERNVSPTFEAISDEIFFSSGCVTRNMERARRLTLSPTGGSVEEWGTLKAYKGDTLMRPRSGAVAGELNVRSGLSRFSEENFPHLQARTSNYPPQFMFEESPPTRLSPSSPVTCHGPLEEEIFVNTLSNRPDAAAFSLSLNYSQTQVSPIMGDIRVNSMNFSHTHFPTFRSPYAGVCGGTRLQGGETDTDLVPLTITHCMSRRSRSGLRSCSFFRLICAIVIVAVTLPFVFICIILGVYFWSIRSVLMEGRSLGRNAMLSEATCLKQLYEPQHYVIENMSREGFIFMVCVALAFIVFIIGGGILFWALPWRFVYSPYLQVLLFICDVSTRLSKIEPLTSAQLSLAQKLLSQSVSFGNRKRGSGVTGLVHKVIALGDTLHELGRYLPPLQRQDIFSSVVNGHGCDVTSSLYAGDRQSDCPSLRSRWACECSSNFSSPREGTIMNCGTGHTNTNPLIDSLSQPYLRKNALTFVPVGQRVDGNRNSFDDTQLTGRDDFGLELSPLRSHFLHSAIPNSSSINTISTSSAAAVIDGSPVMRGQTSNKERTLLDTYETKNGVLNEYGCQVQQVTFLVCRLFLPKLEFLPSGAVTDRCATLTEEMSRRFLGVVLRVAREEYGVPFDIRLDSVVVTFHTPSGPNSVNLVQPRNCAFRLVSELAKLESQWMHIHSSPFVCGIAMHLSQLMIGLSGTVSRHITLMYGEEVKLAYRVAELCRVLNCPLLMLQPCYDVFRVCVTAIPVDVIYKDTSDGKVRICLYDPKAPVEEEDLYSRREQYKPLTEAFGMMCEKNFTDASKKLEGLMDLDHNVHRLYRLCTYFSQQQREGKIDCILPPNTKYVRQGPRWECMEEEAQNFAERSQLHYRLSSSAPHTSFNVSFSRSDLNETETEEVSEAIVKNNFGVTPFLNGVSDFFSCPQSFPTPMQVSATPVPPSLAAQGSLRVYDSESLNGTAIRVSRAVKNSDSQGVCVRHCQRMAASSSMLLDADFDGDMSTPYAADVNRSSIYSNDENRDIGSRMEFDIYEPLGRGSFGTVYRGLHPDGNIVAIKDYPIPDMDEDNPRIRSLRSEIEMLAGCRHKNIVRYINSCFQNGSLYIITEFVSGGSLSALVETFHCLPRDPIRRYTGDVLRGLQYLHERQIVHRDISPNNVLVSIDGVCKLSDFGGAVEYAIQTTSMESDASIRMDQNICTHYKAMTLSPESLWTTSTNTTTITGTVLLKKCFGTPVCMSPEACSGVVDPKNDIWGLGITLCFCFSGCYPWPVEEMKDATSFIAKVRSGLLTPEVPYNMMDAQAADFVRLCLRRDASSRPTAAELLFHAFMVN